MAIATDERADKKAQQVARANAHRPSFFVHDSRARNSVLALGERGSSLTLGKRPMTAHSLLSWVVVGNVQGVRSALAAGADANQKDERGYSAMHLAVSHRRKDIIPVLIAA